MPSPSLAERVDARARLPVRVTSGLCSRSPHRMAGAVDRATQSLQHKGRGIRRRWHGGSACCTRPEGDGSADETERTQRQPAREPRCNRHHLAEDQKHEDCNQHHVQRIDR